MHIYKLAVTSAILALTAACGGGASIQSAEDKFIDDLGDTVTKAEALIELPGTAFAAMPTSGSATFNGAAGIFIDPVFDTDRDDILIVGDAKLTANFANSTMTGAITNMQGATNFGATDADFDLVDVGGSIAIGGNQSLIGVDPDDNLQDRPNQWYADYAGDLAINGDTYGVGGFLLGDFRGTRANPSSGQSPIKAITGSDDDGFAAVNGNIEEVPLTLEVFGEN